MTMSFLSWGSSKPSKAEGVPLDEMKRLQNSLQQGLENVDIMERNSEILIAAVESQTYTVQKLQQELRSCNLQKVLTDKATNTEETNNSGDTGCIGDARRSDRGRHGRKRVADGAYQASDMHHGETDNVVDPPYKQQGLPENTDDILVKLPQNNQENVDILDYKSKEFKAADIAQKLQQELWSCNLQKVLTDNGTKTDKLGHKQVVDGAYQASDMHHGETDSVVDPPYKQQGLPESTDDILVKLLLNNQNVLMKQAILNQKALQNNTRWLQNLQKEVDSLFSQNFESSLNEQDKKYKALEDEKNQLSKKCKDLEEEKIQLSKKCKQLEGEKNQLSKSCKDLEEEKIQLSKNCKEFDEGKKELQKEIENLRKNCDRLSAENNYLKTPAKQNSSSFGLWYPSGWPQAQMKPVKSQVYCPRKSDLTTSVISELDNTLKLQMSSYNLDFVMQTCETPSRIDRSLPLIVICLNASRLGTDVSNALQGVPTGQNVAVLILHHKDIHALPTQSSDRVLTGSEFRNVGAIIDMAYLTSKGMYPCDMNNRALEALKDFIKKHSNI